MLPGLLFPIFIAIDGWLFINRNRKTQGVRVDIDGVIHPDSIPVETGFMLDAVYAQGKLVAATPKLYRAAGMGIESIGLGFIYGTVAPNIIPRGKAMDPGGRQARYSNTSPTSPNSPSHSMSVTGIPSL
jgi:hypothetical protein